MEVRKECEFCNVICGIHYVYNMRVTEYSNDKLFIENCTSELLTNITEDDCNCLMLTHYIAINNALARINQHAGFVEYQSTADFANKNVKLKECSKFTNATFKFDLKPAVNQFFDSVETQYDVLDILFNTLDATTRLGLLCLLHTYVVIIQECKKIDSIKKYYDVLYELFFSTDEDSEVHKVMQMVCTNAEYYNVFTHYNCIINAGVDAEQRENIKFVLECLRKSIMYLQTTSRKQPVWHNWFWAIWSLRTWK